MKCDRTGSPKTLTEAQASAPKSKKTGRGPSVKDLLVRGGTLLLAASAGRLPGVAADRPMPALPQPTSVPTRTLLSDAAASPGMPAPAPWTGTWSASPQASTLQFADQTLRQIVHTSIGGHHARLHLSNVFGNDTAELAHVFIGQQASGSAVVPATQRRVTFDGEHSVAIGAGEDVISDEIEIKVPALSNMAISLYVPGNLPAATCHTLASQTNFVAEGDVAHHAQITPSKTLGSYCFLSNLDVKNPSSRGALVALGASVTDGFASAADANHRWPDYLALRLAAANKTVGVLNQGISGNRLLTDLIGESALGRLHRDALTQPNVRWVIFSDDPINDIGANRPPRSSDELIAGYKTLIAQTRAAGLRMLCSTMPPYEGAFYWVPAGEVKRQALNAFIRQPGNGCDGIVDQDMATHDPDHPTRYLPIYDSGDHLHPSDAGRQAIANAVNISALV